MGAWGTGPFDNDGAADMMAGISREITEALKPKSNHSASYHYSEARAAAALLLFSHGTDILGGPSLEPALAALERMRGDEEWIGVWRSELEICQQLDKEIRALRRKIKTCCAPKKAEAERQRAKRREVEPSRAFVGVVPKELWTLSPDDEAARATPFYELINFSDCEGFIGPKTSAKLAKDFAAWQEKAGERGWFSEKYAQWRAAFELAANGGVVQFH